MTQYEGLDDRDFTTLTFIEQVCFSKSVDVLALHQLHHVNLQNMCTGWGVPRQTEMLMYEVN